jgi:predicted GNAT family acetyltransferase
MFAATGALSEQAGVAVTVYTQPEYRGTRDYMT